MEEGNSFGVVRKGAWTKEEDDRLRHFVQQHGEGKWRQGSSQNLNRCWKSCRQRWLNYLKPSIKRGKFREDEIDLMTSRLRMLLGNRWSLIAGRLPGRTANDVKNYWTTRLRRKKLASDDREKDHKPLQQIQVEATKTVIIRPRPRTFSNNLNCLGRKLATTNLQQHNYQVLLQEPSPMPSLSTPTEINGNTETSLGDGNKGTSSVERALLCYGLQLEKEDDLFTNLWDEEYDVMADTTTTTTTTAIGVNCSSTQQEEEEGSMSRNHYFSSFDDMDIWNNSKACI